MGAGYTIPISLAFTPSASNQISAPWQINLRSPSAGFTSNPNMESTPSSTASTALGGNSEATTGFKPQTSSGGFNPLLLLLLIGGAAVAIWMANR